MTGIGLRLVGLDLLTLANGHAILYVLGIARLRPADLRLVGLSYLTGWASLGVVLTLSLISGIGTGVPVTIGATALVVGGCAARGRLGSVSGPRLVRDGRRARPPLSVLAAGAGAGVIVVELAAAVVASVKSVWSTDLDLLTAWLPRAAMIHEAHHLHAADWGSSSFLVPWYPPLVPVMYAGTFDFAGGFHPSVLPLQQVILGIAFVLSVACLLDRVAPRWLTLPSLALLVTAPWFWWRLHSLLPDQTLGYLIGCAAIVSILWLHERRGAWLGLGTIFLAAAALTKIEGVLFGALLVGTVLALGLLVHRRAALPAAVLALGPAAIVPWHLWLSRNHVATSTPDYNAPHVLNAGFLAERFDRFTFALHAMFTAALPSAGLVTPAIIWTAVVAALVAAWRLPLLAAAAAGWLGLSFLGLGAIYWTGRIEVHWYVYTSASRVGATIIIAAAVLSPLLLGLALGTGAASGGEPVQAGEEGGLDQASRPVKRSS